MKHFFKFTFLFIVLAAFAPKAKAQSFDLVINSTCTCCPGGGLDVTVFDAFGNTIGVWPISAGTITCIPYVAGFPPAQLQFKQNPVRTPPVPPCFSAMFTVNTGTTSICSTCTCGCLNNTRNFSSTYSTGTGTLCPPNADVLTITVN